MTTGATQAPARSAAMAPIPKASASDPRPPPPVPTDDEKRAKPLGAGGGGRGSLALAFGMGAIAALLAGACVAPVVIQVVLFSSNLYAQGSVIALGLPFVLGIGMAIPWPIAGAGLTRLPKPGAWMVRVKQALGIVILATAAYYG